MSTQDPSTLPLPLAPQFARYASAGAVGTGFHYAVLITLVQIAHIGPVAASTAGAILGAIINYALNHRYTFASDRPHARAFPRFALIAVAGVAMNAIVVAAVLAYAGFNFLVAQVVATGVVLATGFIANRTWTF